MQETVLSRYVVTKLEQVIDLVAGMDPALVGTVPDLPGGNSAYQLLTHCLGMTQQWTREHILGEPTGRDREAEFRAEGDPQELVSRARAYLIDLESDLARIDPAQPPAGRPWGTQPFWIGTVDGILLHVLEELCQHLGHLEITRDLVTTGGGDARSG